MSIIYSTSTTSTAVTWNGPICPTCGARYLGSHTCSWDDLQRRIEELRTAQDRLTRGPVKTPEFETILDRTATCPCRPENGGSGVCGCVLSGPTIT
jgi:hypothetical protein